MSSFKCPKCNFIQMYSILGAADGSVSDNPRKEADKPCPNDGEKLLPCTDEGDFLQ